LVARQEGLANAQLILNPVNDAFREFLSANGRTPESFLIQLLGYLSGAQAVFAALANPGGNAIEVLQLLVPTDRTTYNMLTDVATCPSTKWSCTAEWHCILRFVRSPPLGWAPERVLVFDEDQGFSGARADNREGFQRLLAEVTMDHVGLVLGLEMSRLARSSKDWHQLFELCGVFGSLLADEDGIYEPNESNGTRKIEQGAAWRTVSMCASGICND
jgi:Resolvase, N terminal domain